MNGLVHQISAVTIDILRDGGGILEIGPGIRDIEVRRDAREGRIIVRPLDPVTAGRIQESRRLAVVRVDPVKVEFRVGYEGTRARPCFADG